MLFAPLTDGYTAPLCGITGKKLEVRRMSIIGPSPSSGGLKPSRLGPAADRGTASGKGSTQRPELVLSNSRRGYGSSTQFPKSLGRAAEEYVFLKVSTR